MKRREPKHTESYLRGCLFYVAGGGLCSKHGEYIGEGKHGLRSCPFCDIEEFYKKANQPKSNSDEEKKR